MPECALMRLMSDTEIGVHDTNDTSKAIAIKYYMQAMCYVLNKCICNQTF